MYKIDKSWVKRSKKVGWRPAHAAMYLQGVKDTLSIVLGDLIKEWKNRPFNDREIPGLAKAIKLVKTTKA